MHCMAIYNFACPCKYAFWALHMLDINLILEKKQSALCLVPPSPRVRFSTEALVRYARGLRAVTRHRCRQR
jgi:hypothetical protein